MTLAPGRFDYAPINDRPIIKWPDNARVAFWVAPNMEFFEYLPQNRPTQPDIPHYSRMDYGNRVGFWRMLDVLNKHKVRACCCLNLELLDHFPEIKDAMIAANWDYMAHGLYNSRPIYDYTEEQERAYWQDFITHLKEMTGKRLKGRLGGGAGYTVRTDDLMAEAGCLYHTSWIIDDQPWPINVRGTTPMRTVRRSSSQAIAPRFSKVRFMSLFTRRRTRSFPVSDLQQSAISRRSYAPRKWTIMVMRIP